MSNRLKESTKLLDCFARDIREEANHVAIAGKHNLPLYEVVSGNTTLELSRFFQVANKHFEKYSTVRMYRILNGFKTLYRVKKNDKVLIGDLDKLGQVGI